MPCSSPAAQAADTGNSAPQTGKIVSDEPGKNAPNILDGTVYSLAKVGNTIIVGGQFSQAQNYNTSSTLTRRNLLAFDATTGKILTSFAPDPVSTVYKVLPAADGESVYVAGRFTSAAGVSMPGRLFKINVTTGALDPNFVAQTISGDIRDLDLVGNHLFLAGKFTHINGVAQKALGTVYADTGKRDPYFNAVFSGLHRPEVAGAVTNVLQISINKQNNQLMAVGNFTNVDGQARSQIAKFNVGNTPTTVDATVHQTLSTWTTNLYTSGCSSKFDTYMSDVEFSPDGTYFVVSTIGCLRRRHQQQRHRRLRRRRPVREQLHRALAGHLDGVHRRRHHVDRRGHRQRHLHRRPHALAEQPRRGRHRRPGRGQPRGHRRAQPGQRACRTRGTRPAPAASASRTCWRPATASTSAPTPSCSVTRPATPTTPASACCRSRPAPGCRRCRATTCPSTSTRSRPAATQLQKRSFTGTTAGTAANVPTGPGWGTSTGAFMVNGVLYKLNTDGSLSKMTFDGTNYGTVHRR